MAKKVTKKLKLQVPGGAAVPGQALGPALGQAGINIGDFVKRFNDASKDRKGEIVPVIISVYEDRSYDFILKTSPAANMVLAAIKKEKGSGKPNTSKVGTITKAQIKEIAEKKMADLNTRNIESAIKMIEGTCRSMGVDVR